MRRMNFDKPGLDGAPTVTIWSLKEWPPRAAAVVEHYGQAMVAPERLYWRADGRLAYPAGAVVPAAEIDALVGETEHFAVLRGETPPVQAEQLVEDAPSDAPELFEPAVPRRQRRDDTTMIRQRARGVERR